MGPEAVVNRVFDRDSGLDDAFAPLSPHHAAESGELTPFVVNMLIRVSDPQPFLL